MPVFSQILTVFENLCWIKSLSICKASFGFIFSWPTSLNNCSHISRCTLLSAACWAFTVSPRASPPSNPVLCANNAPSAGQKRGAGPDFLMGIAALSVVSSAQVFLLKILLASRKFFVNRLRVEIPTPYLRQISSPVLLKTVWPLSTGFSVSNSASCSSTSVYQLSGVTFMP